MISLGGRANGGFDRVVRADEPELWTGGEEEHGMAPRKWDHPRRLTVVRHLLRQEAEAGLRGDGIPQCTLEPCFVTGLPVPEPEPERSEHPSVPAGIGIAAVACDAAVRSRELGFERRHG